MGKWQFDLNQSNVPQRKGEDEFTEPNGYYKDIVNSSSNRSNLLESSAQSGSGSSNSSEIQRKKDAEKTLALKEKRAMEIAYAPGKNLFMTAFMMYMSGSSIQIFSIMITGMALFNPIKSIFTLNNAFTSVNDGRVNLIQAKVVFVLVNLVGLAIALYKCATMGLLPTTSADWTWLLPMKYASETSTRAFLL